MQMWDAPWCGRMSRRREPKGAAEPGARAVAGRLFDRDPPEDRLRRPALAFELTEGEASDSRCSRSCSTRSGHRAARAVGDKGTRTQEEPRGGPRAEAICPVIPYKGKEKNRPAVLCEGALSGTRPHRAARRQAQALQTNRSPMRENGSQLRLLRRPCPRIHPGEIRPHDLERNPITSGRTRPRRSNWRTRAA